jgi:hypothetical protein
MTIATGIVQSHAFKNTAGLGVVFHHYCQGLWGYLLHRSLTAVNMVTASNSSPNEGGGGVII